MVETRSAPRHRVLKAGTIKFGGMTIDCVVRNLSSTGAALEVSSKVGMPENFTLVLSGDGLKLSCRTVWRGEYRIGVVFD
jgi:PilZ domain